MKQIAFLIALFFCSNAFAQNPYLIVGTYTSGKSEGIYVYKFNSSTGTLDSISKIKSPNPSFLAISPNEKFVYAVYEQANNNTVGGSIAAFSFNKQNGQLSFINEQLTGGDHPCHVAINRRGDLLAAANYTGGSLSLLRLKEDGSIDKPQQIIQMEGASIHPTRQTKPHVHFSHFSATAFQLFATDLGTDKIMIYNIDPFTHELKPGKQPYMASKPGSGPRHMDFSSDNKFAYLIEELSGTVVTYRYKNRKLKFKQRISTLPADFKGEAGSADIHLSPDGNFLYCSNRGTSNTIAIFKRNKKDGKLTNIGFQSTLGIGPRNFTIDPTGNYLLVANQKSDNIIVFKRDVVTGLLTDTGKTITVGNPVCLKWISSY